MQSHVFVPSSVSVPPECELIASGVRVNHREGVVIRPRKGWVVVPGVCCDEWDITREKRWTCPTCETPWEQVHHGSWRQSVTEQFPSGPLAAN